MSGPANRGPSAQNFVAAAPLLFSAVIKAMNYPLIQSLQLRTRLRTIAAATVLILLMAGGMWTTFSVSTSPAATHERATLRERLVYGLLAKIPSELAFIELVVLKVDEGKLPVELVNQTFFWARERATPSQNGSPRRPIIFFKPAMTARAKRIGVEL